MYDDIAFLFVNYYRLLLVPTVIVFSFWCLKKWMQGQHFSKKTRLDGKTIVITGANTGIGYETAKDLASRGACIIIGGRDAIRTSAAVASLKEITNNKNISYELLDLASLKSVKLFAKKVLKRCDHIHVLINNAGVMWCPYTKTEDGYEMQFATNHLGHFYLTNLLLDRIKESAPSRIITVSSIVHQAAKIKFNSINSASDYDPIRAYASSKLANILFTLKLTEKLKGTRVTANSLHPGVINTEISRHIPFLKFKIMRLLYMPLGWLFKTPYDGAQTTIYAAVDEDLENVSGKYFSECKLTEPSPRAHDLDAADRLWELSEQMIKDALGQGEVSVSDGLPLHAG